MRRCHWSRHLHQREQTARLCARIALPFNRLENRAAQTGDVDDKTARRTMYLLFSSCAWLVVATGVFAAWMATPFFPQYASHPRLWFAVALLAAPVALFGIPAALILRGGHGLLLFAQPSTLERRKAWVVPALPFDRLVWFGALLLRRVPQRNFRNPAAYSVLAIHFAGE